MSLSIAFCLSTIVDKIFGPPIFSFNYLIVADGMVDGSWIVADGMVDFDDLDSSRIR